MRFMDKFAIVLRKKEAVMHEFTPDGLMITYGIGAAFAVGILYVLFRTVGNGANIPAFAPLKDKIT